MSARLPSSGKNIQYMKHEKKLISDEIIERVRRDNCFDILRYFFALSLILVHFCTLTDTQQFWIVSGQMRVKAFFTITGFLVVYSYIRRGKLSTYTQKRIRRILPAYATVIILCILAGIFITPLNGSQYLFSTQTLKYLLANITFLNFLQPSLPGLFPDSPVETAVNGSLWSMKYEILFYILVPLIIALMRRYGKKNILIAIFATYIAFRAFLDFMEYHTGKEIYNAISTSSPTTIIYFFSGTTILLCFDWFCRHIKTVVIACVAFFLAIAVMHWDFLYYVEPLAFSAIIIAIAYYCKPLNFLQHYDNISYGLYLYHYPVIQILIRYDIHQQNITLCLILTFVITIILALLSWYIIEKPLLNR